MKVTLLGARGSFPHIGPEMVRYGGNTSCVEVVGDDGTVVILDAGTGLRNAASAVDPNVRRMDILLTHFHMDHLQGLGFFRPLFDPSMEVHIWGPPSTTMTLHRRLARYLSPPLFPVCIRDFTCKLELHDAPRRKFQLGGLEVTSDLVCHPGPTMGYRVSNGRSAIAYLPDHEVALASPSFPLEPEWTSGLALCKEADLLLHDSQYDEGEYAARVGWGHSTSRHSAQFAAEAGVKRLLTFHHDPNHDDDTIDCMVREAASAASGVEVTGGAEGATFEFPAVA
ncbi:MAG: MBL fold metallo-hydrolase [Dehalococcoidia bacterium]